MSRRASRFKPSQGADRPASPRDPAREAREAFVQGEIDLAKLSTAGQVIENLIAECTWASLPGADLAYLPELYDMGLAVMASTTSGRQVVMEEGLSMADAIAAAKSWAHIVNVKRG